MTIQDSRRKLIEAIEAAKPDRGLLDTGTGVAFWRERTFLAVATILEEAVAEAYEDAARHLTAQARKVAEGVEGKRLSDGERRTVRFALLAHADHIRALRVARGVEDVRGHAYEDGSGPLPCQQRMTIIPPPLPEGACHWMLEGVGIVCATHDCEHVNLNDRQRRFIRDVGTKAAWADGGTRLAEMGDELRAHNFTNDQGPGEYRYFPPSELFPDEGLQGSPNLDPPSRGVAVGWDDKSEFVVAQPWPCDNHVEPFLNDAASAKCEVCGGPKP